MSATLNPSVPTVTSIRASIQAMLKAEMPADLLATSVAPLLVNVDKWADQIPAVLEGPGAVNVNLVFSIRKDLFVVPSFTQSTFGPVLAELPAPFKDFINFTYQLIEAQKPNDKDKPVPKVCLSFLSQIIMFLICTLSVDSKIRRSAKVYKSKAIVEDDDVEIVSTPVSDPITEAGNKVFPRRCLILFNNVICLVYFLFPI